MNIYIRRSPFNDQSLPKYLKAHDFICFSAFVVVGFIIPNVVGNMYLITYIPLLTTISNNVKSLRSKISLYEVPALRTFL